MKVNITYTIKAASDDFKLNTNYIRNFYFVEDLESMFMTAQLEVEDKGGWVEKLPITGNETFEIDLIQEDEDKNIKVHKTLFFEIYDIKMETGTTGRTNIYTFMLVEKGFFELLRIYYSCSFKEKTVSEIITSIFNKQLMFEKNKIKFDVEKTVEKINFTIPYWKPTTSIKYLSKIAKRSKSPQEAGFLFYSTLGPDDEETSLKRFVSLATLLEQKAKTEPEEKYYLRNSSISIYYLNNILEVKNLSLSNKTPVKNGIGGKTFYGINFLDDKRVLKESVKLSDYIKDSIFLGETSYYTKDIEDPNSEVQFRGYSNKDLIKNEINYLFRLAFEDINKREIYCKGSLKRYCGKIIQIEEVSGNVDEMVNENLSGTWLIKKIVHYCIGESFEQKMVILKNSFGKLQDVPKQLSLSKTNK